MLLVHRALILCHLAIFCDLAFGKCLTHLEEVHPKLFFTVREGRCDIIIETSQRVTHNITSNIFKILLDEVLGYDSVHIVQRNDYFNSSAFESLLDYHLHPDKFPNAPSGCPSSSINLEIWVNTVPSLAEEGHQKVNYPRELGTISTPGRFGWFVVQNQPQKGAIDSVYWKVFKDQATASEYDINLSDYGFDLNYVTWNGNSNKRYCEHSECENGMYTPEKCRSSKCALLLVGDYDVTNFVINDIKSFELYVRAIWVGPHLKNVSGTLIQKVKKERIVILSWSPSEVTASANFVAVAFPPCRSDNIESAGCRYEYHRLVKSASVSLKSGAQSAYTAVTDMYLTHSQYVELLRSHLANPTLSHYDIACKWMRSNWATWKHWNQTKQNEIKILGIFPLSSSYNGAAIADAAESAVMAINNNNSVLRDMKLHLMVHDGNCDSNVVINNFIDTIRATDDYEKTIGILGPACSDTVEALINVCKYFLTVAISYSAEGSIFSDRSKYPFFFRTIGDNQDYVSVYLNLLKRLGWKRMASITEAGQKYTQYIPHLIEMMENHNLTFIYNSEIPKKGDTIKGVRSNLEALKAKGARIIVAHVYAATAKAVMCAAYQLNMTAADGYVWFLPQWLKPRWYDAGVKDECTTEEIVEALNGHFSLAHAYFAPDDSIMQENITVGQWKQNYRNQSAWSDYAGYAYDAVWVYALAFDELYRQDNYAASRIHSRNSTERFVKFIRDTDFNGVSGRVKFTSGTSRISVVNILQWVNHRTNIVGSFYPNETLPGVNTEDKFELNVSAIVWLTRDGKQPDDGAETCLLQALADLLNVNCGVAMLVANVMGFSILGLTVIIAFLFTKHRYDKKVRKIQKAQELMKSWGLDLLAPNLTDLDKWEMPRDHLVINRKLGEGAFGTVYGGEAYFCDKGWVAAAVKALKVNSTTEQKLDFLSEAEVMKKFDHKNIVKLLGVCTKQEPVYTVMEFMLYGDLKTFLLARRHLVNNKKLHEESDEISSKKLTMMALDVARGLSYLAQLKYVHRDIASRNCLINYARVVKIGDFGMTRSMFENDYYKFSRKGMMPVRWMAPESLALGIFTPASDIWSYGVLLYEIITFGSFPFQGMSNNQVMEHVKSGNTITIPTGIKPQLEFLMKSCWNLEFKKRPQASEIVEFLANNPRLISPCLDVPLSSVEMEDTGQLEFNLPNNIRKLSLTFNSKNEESETGGIRHRSVSNDSEPFSMPVLPYYDESSVFLPNGYTNQNENCPWIPLLNNSKTGGEGSSRSSSITAGLGKIITIHRSESCDDCENSEHRTHQTSL